VTFYCSKWATNPHSFPIRMFLCESEWYSYIKELTETSATSPTTTWYNNSKTYLLPIINHRESLKSLINCYCKFPSYVVISDLLMYALLATEILSSSSSRTTHVARGKLYSVVLPYVSRSLKTGLSPVQVVLPSFWKLNNESRLWAGHSV
jgi:hypothetical protein